MLDSTLALISPVSIRVCFHAAVMCFLLITANSTIKGTAENKKINKENDISWIWDIDFEILKHDSVKNIILIGKFCYDLDLRMKYANIDSDKIILVPDLKDLSKIIKKKTKGNIYSMVCFDKEIQLKNIIKEEQK